MSNAEMAAVISLVRQFMNGYYTLASIVNSFLFADRRSSRPFFYCLQWITQHQCRYTQVRRSRRPLGICGTRCIVKIMNTVFGALSTMDPQDTYVRTLLNTLGFHSLCSVEVKRPCSYVIGRLIFVAVILQYILPMRHSTRSCARISLRPLVLSDFS